MPAGGLGHALSWRRRHLSAYKIYDSLDGGSPHRACFFERVLTRLQQISFHSRLKG